MQKLAKAKVSASSASLITILKSAFFLSGTLSMVDGVTSKSPIRKRYSSHRKRLKKTFSLANIFCFLLPIREAPRKYRAKYLLVVVQKILRLTTCVTISASLGK